MKYMKQKWIISAFSEDLCKYWSNLSTVTTRKIETEYE